MKGELVITEGPLETGNELAAEDAAEHVNAENELIA
jgi:hypothetical protein